MARPRKHRPAEDFREPEEIQAAEEIAAPELDPLPETDGGGIAEPELEPELEGPASAPASGVGYNAVRFRYRGGNPRLDRHFEKGRVYTRAEVRAKRFNPIRMCALRYFERVIK